MSLLVNNHKGIGKTYLVPVFTGHVGYSFTTVGSVVLTPGTTPIAGELMVITVGGAQARTITPPSGWTLVTRVTAGLTLGFMWKVATASEPSTYTVTWNSTMSGGASFQQFLYCDTDFPVVNTVGASSLATASLVLPAIAVPHNGVAITYFCKSNTNTDWNPDNGWTRTLIAGQHCIARREFAIHDLGGEVCTWAGTSDVIYAEMTFIRARYVR